MASLSEMTVAIAGLGLMGGSLALALRGQCARLIGVEIDPASIALAREQGVVDRVGSDAAALLPEADLIILATPVQTIIEMLRALPAWQPGPVVVMDLGSTKTAVTQAMGTLPARFDPIGGHPMCGKELSGLAHAEADLFRDAPFAFVPLPRSSSAARHLAEQVATAVSAYPLWLDAKTHDRWTAATSHLPYLIANVLAAVTPLEAKPLAGSGFRSTTRLAPTSRAMMGDILATNRAEVLVALKRFQEHLARLAAHLEADEREELLDHLTQGAERQQKLTSNNQQITDNG